MTLAALIAFCEGLLCHVNLIPMNAVEGTGVARSSRDRAVRFRDALKRSGTEASVRVERGADIHAACGMLARKLYRAGA